MTPRGAGHVLPRWALPGELAALDGGRPGRRTPRDWVADAGLFGVAVLVWLWSWRDLVISPDPGYVAVVEDWMLAIDPWVGAAACVALWWRRRFPLALAVAMVPVLAVSGTALGAVLIAIFTVAIHRGWLSAILVTAAQAGQAVWFALIYQPPRVSTTAYVVMMVLIFVVPLACGMVVRYRRQVLVGLRREAQRERSAHRQRVAEAQRAERERIAREMHDALAHRISLLSVHAGALAYRTSQAEAKAAAPLTAAEVGQAVQVIRDNAHQALTELGEVLAVLRAGEPDDDAAGNGGRRPPPLLVDIERLAEEARAAGQPVTVELAPALAGAPPRAQEQRTVYRVVQEGLTNARKHAPQAPVAVRVAGAPGSQLAVAVTNPLPAGAAAAGIPGAGVGLAGLAERVELDGGTLQHGPVDGGFRLAAQLPWHA